MLKNLIVYRLGKLFDADLAAIEQVLAANPFIQCGATQELSYGWAPVRGEASGAMLESINGQWIARFFSEVKQVPAEVLARRVSEKAVRIEQETGRKPGKKETKELKDEALLDLLPMAFTKQVSTYVWIDKDAGTLAIDASSQSRADDVVSALVSVLPGLTVSLLCTNTSPQAAMSHWLTTQEAPVGFTVDRECELKSDGEDKAVVRYANHALDIDEVQAHIAQGKLPTKLALTFDGRVSILLTEGLQIKKISILDVATSGAESGFDADVAITTAELRAVITGLIEALGGELKSDAEDPSDDEVLETLIDISRAVPGSVISLRVSTDRPGGYVEGALSARLDADAEFNAGVAVLP